MTFHRFEFLSQLVDRGAIEHPLDPRVDDELTEARIRHLTTKVRIKQRLHEWFGHLDFQAS
jgi:hypothetical protein